MKKQNGTDDVESNLIVNEHSLRNRIYTIRGQKVMLDFDLAAIYGYETKAFNRQVRNNIEKFRGDDFMFQLSRSEVDNLSWCKNCTTINDDIGLANNSQTGNNHSIMQGAGIKGGRVYLPYAFTEQGIYMLMTVLRGKLATQQSRDLIRTFKAMKDYVFANREQLDYKDSIKLALRVSDNTDAIAKMWCELERLDAEVSDANKRLSGAVMKSDISPVVLDFNRQIEQRELLIANGEFMKASELYMNIYGRARKSIHIIDNYVGIKTLSHLRYARNGVKIYILCSANNKYLSEVDLKDFRKEYPMTPIEPIRVRQKIHDRFIIIDCGEKEEVIYHCGGSEKDAGAKITVITKLDDKGIKEAVRNIASRSLTNQFENSSV